jgi:hypothetical protein
MMGLRYPMPTSSLRASRRSALAVRVVLLAALAGAPGGCALRDPSAGDALVARARQAAAAPAPDLTDRAGIRIRGSAELGLLTRRALDRLLATHVGVRVRERLASGALPQPLTIEVNVRGDDFTPYSVPGRVLGETIVFDPWTLPLVETERGRLPATRETVLAHEMGHAVFKLRSEDDVIREVENPVRDELGLPRRTRF